MSKRVASAALIAVVSVGVSVLSVPTVVAQEGAAAVVCPAKEGDAVPPTSIVADERDEDTNSIHVVGRGWCAQPGHGGSNVAVKIDRGAYDREDQSSLPEEFRNRGVWQIIEADEKTGDFDVTIELPKDISEGDHDLFFLSGSFKKDDQGNLIDISRSQESHFIIGEHIPDESSGNSPYVDGFFFPEKVKDRPYNVRIATKLPFERKDNIVVLPDNENKQLKVVYPAGQPGEWINVQQLTFNNERKMDDDKGWYIEPSSTEKVCDESESWSFDHVEDGEYTPFAWHKLDENRSATIPYAYLKKTVGPSVLVARTEKWDFNVPWNSLLGWAWMNNHGAPGDQELYPGFVDPITPDRNIYEAYKEWAGVADLPEGQMIYRNEDKKNFEANVFGCRVPLDRVVEKPDVSAGLAVAYPVEPVVDGGRNIVIPQSPAVEYFIDGKRVSGKVAPAGDEASEVEVVAKPAFGFRFVLPQDDGRIDPAQNTQTSYKVSVPAASTEKKLIEAPQSGPRSDAGAGSVSVSPDRVKAGEVITLTGKDYPDLSADGHIAVKIDDGGKIKPNPNQEGTDVLAPEGTSDYTAVKAELMPGADGSWSAKVRIPGDLAPGRHWVRLLSNNGAGTANGSHHGEFKVTDADGKVPGESEQPSEPVVVDPPSVNVLRGMLQDQKVSVKDPAKLSDAELKAIKDAVVHALGQGYTVSVAGGKVVASREGGEDVTYALAELFPTKSTPAPEPKPEPKPGNDSSSQLGSAAGVGVIGALVGALLAVLGIGGFIASNPAVVDALPQPIRQLLGR